MSQTPVTTDPEPTTPGPTPQQPSGGVRWPLVLAVVAAVLVLGLVAWLLLRDDGPPASAEPLAAPGQPYEASFQRAIDDLERFWAEELPETYQVEYTDLRHGVFAYSTADPPPNCGPESFSYQDMANNAYYCPPQLIPDDTDLVASGDYIAYDEESLFPEIAQRFGAAGVAAITAHEWGHAIQNRGSVGATTIELELQADCFAGAWMRPVHAEESPHLTATLADLDRAAAALLTFRDPQGADPTSDTAHGNGFDRVAAFQDGFVNGPQKCTTYPAGGVEYTESVYTSWFDLAAEGNAPLDSLAPIVFDGLDGFWSTRFEQAFEDSREAYSPVSGLEQFSGTAPDCPGGAVPLPAQVHDAAYYCPSNDTLGWTQDGPTAELYDLLGDGAVATVLADRWGFAMREKAGEAVSGIDASLQVDCTTGAWFRTAFGKGALSPGDLDESIAALLASSLLLDFGEDRGTGFVRVGAFRVGFDKGIGECSQVEQPSS